MLRCTVRVHSVAQYALRRTALLLSSASRTRRRRAVASSSSSFTDGGSSAAAHMLPAAASRDLDEVVADAHLYDEDEDGNAYALDDDELFAYNKSATVSDSAAHGTYDDGEAAAPARGRRTRHSTRAAAAAGEDEDEAAATLRDDTDVEVMAAAARAPVVERSLGGIVVDALPQQEQQRRRLRKPTRTAKTAAASPSARLLRPPSPPAAAAAAAALQAADDDDSSTAAAAAAEPLTTAADMAEHEAAAAAETTTTTTSALQVTNPFVGLHDLLSRSYRLEPLLSNATPHELLFARQERASTAFSFLHVRASTALYTQHWSALPQLTAHHGVLHAAQRQHTAVPGFTLFNNNLGFDSPRVQHSYPLIVAQRLLLFPDALRHFHALCGRDGVPCDFYADIDMDAATLANDSKAATTTRKSSSSAAAASLQREGETALLDVLNYLEVRLPSIGFTDPLFLVLANEAPSAEKVSYHVHARSMTYMTAPSARQQPQQREDDDDGGGVASSNSSCGSGKQKRSNAAAKRKKTTRTAADADAKADDDEDEKDSVDDDDDLSDCVSAVEGGSGGATTTAGCSKKNNKKKATTAAAAGGAGASSIIAFQDYRTVKLLADEVNEALGRAVIDEGCYRARGMLRCAFSAKLHSNQDTHRRGLLNDPRRRLVPLLHAHDAALQRKLTHMEQALRTMTDPEVLELSFCTRHVDDVECGKTVHAHIKQQHYLGNSGGGKDMTEQQQLLHATARHRFKLLRPRHVQGAQAGQAQEYDAYGNAISPFLLEAAKWRRYKGVVAKLRTLPPRAAESYDVWIRVGLALHNFSNEDHVFDEWVRFSLKCPHKYSRESCRRKWLQFERNPDALNWRRGFNYLNSTVWRQIG